MSVTPARPQLTWPAPIQVLALLAVALPMLLAPSVSPTSTFLNQFCAFGGTALWLGFWAQGHAPQAPLRLTPVVACMLLLWLVLAAAQGLSEAPGGQRILPVASLVLACVGAAAAAWDAQQARVRPGAQAGGLTAIGRHSLWTGLLIGLLVAGLLSVVISAVQVFKPGWTDSIWIAVPNAPGRAIGNMRQPNQLSTLLLWACAAAVGLAVQRRWRWQLLAGLLAALVLAVVATASRTGTVGVGLLALWGLIDRRLPGRVRLLLLATPLVYALGWWGMEQWSAHTGQFFYGDDQVKKTLHGDASSSRGRIWANTLALIAQHPWTGVGAGAFNFMWTMTPFPDRPVAFFDHSHNLLLQLAVESGLPLAATVVVLLAALALLSRAAWTQADEARARSARCATFMLALVLVHSLLEYPLWYAYFLLPTALVLGTLVGLVPLMSDVPNVPNAPRTSDPSAAPASPPAHRPPRQVSALVMQLVCIGVSAAGMLGSGWALSEYHRVAVIFDPALAIGTPGSLADRISAGQRTVLFGHHADYAQVTMATHPDEVFAAFERPLYHLLDTRLMLAYAQALAARGDVLRARHVAARLREFHNPASEAFFAPCEAAVKAAASAPESDPLPFQCGPDPQLDPLELRP
ncbi:MAG: Wzy polymerase domain-containing protein [Leptothrix sp. (in: b-proteobacteria)]